MSHSNVEGTFRLDGLIEGRVPAEGGVERLKEWVALARKTGLRFSLEVEGDSFSLLGEPDPVSAEGLAPKPAKAVQQALEQLARAFTADEATQLFSTLRSSEFAPGIEVQTVYAFQPGGGVEFREREVETETVAPIGPLTRKELVKRIGLGVLVFLAIFGISAIFVDYKALLGELTEAAMPVDESSLGLDATAFERWFVIEKVEARRIKGGHEFALTLKRTEQFPTGEELFEREYREAGSDYRRRLALDALARGYLRCEFYDAEDAFLGFGLARVADLRRAATIRIVVPLPKRVRPHRIVLRY